MKMRSRERTRTHGEKKHMTERKMQKVVACAARRLQPRYARKSCPKQRLSPPPLRGSGHAVIAWMVLVNVLLGQLKVDSQERGWKRMASGRKICTRLMQILEVTANPCSYQQGRGGQDAHGLLGDTEVYNIYRIISIFRRSICSPGYRQYRPLIDPRSDRSIVLWKESVTNSTYG